MAMHAPVAAEPYPPIINVRRSQVVIEGYWCKTASLEKFCVQQCIHCDDVETVGRLAQRNMNRRGGRRMGGRKRRGARVVRQAR